MIRVGRVMVVIVAIQAASIAIFWLVEQRRSAGRGSERELRTEPPQSVDGALQPLSLKTWDGRRFELREFERPTLVHFWATWCPPCRAELPGLLALSEEHPVEVVAVALDERWTAVARFLGGRPPSSVYLGESVAIESALGVHSLPVTYLVEPGGSLLLRFDGARDWTNRAFLSSWMSRAGIE